MGRVEVGADGYTHIQCVRRYKTALPASHQMGFERKLQWGQTMGKSAPLQLKPSDQAYL